MNTFRLIGDLSHSFAILMLLLKIWKTRTCAGISGKSQLLLAMVFVTRYSDLFTNFVSVYNTVMKVLFITASFGTMYLIFLKFNASYDRRYDSFRVEFLAAPCLVLALAVNHELTVLEVLWTFSVYLETVALIPQLFMIVKSGQAPSIVAYYLLAHGVYRFAYIQNWAFRYYFDNKYFCSIAFYAGCVHMAVLLIGNIIACSLPEPVSNKSQDFWFPVQPVYTIGDQRFAASSYPSAVMEKKQLPTLANQHSDSTMIPAVHKGGHRVAHDAEVKVPFTQTASI